MAEQAKAKEDNALPPEDKEIVVNRSLVGKKRHAFIRVARAGYTEGQVPVRDAAGKLILDPVLENGVPKVQDGKPVKRIRTRTAKYGFQREDGDYIETDEDLSKHNVRGYPPVFQVVDKERSPQTEQLAEVRRRNGALVESRRRLLSGLTAQQLREYAESEGLDVGRAAKKEELLQAIDAAQNGQLMAAAA